tara:strand:+ start:2511 stop:2786 length:276 start_codon:yes stop_codon:yes gene_type:complete
MSLREDPILKIYLASGKLGLQKPMHKATFVTDQILGGFICPVQFEKSHSLGVHQCFPLPKLIILADSADKLVSKYHSFGCNYFTSHSSVQI